MKRNERDYGRNVLVICLNRIFMKIITGNSNKHLSLKISKYLKNRLVRSSIRRFFDGEIYIEINENIRGNSIL